MKPLSGNSRPVASARGAAHEHLEKVVRSHFAKPCRAPLHRPTVEAFEKLTRLAGAELPARPLVLDSGCGTGESTREIAAAWPEALVLGIDRSARRLARTGHREFPVRDGNLVWVRAELASFWRLALDRQWQLARHYLLYPNPYPKRAQLRKRWHGHPVFPALLGLGGALELRSNWRVYVEEFARALACATGQTAHWERLAVSRPISGFERKYLASGHPLYRLVH
ncbi:MAG TPA: methyltransferase domain-containing protein [Xanthomonadales bacterium]|nr:methyltransferase domain-containing protein [Xanthomonadales bacterium]